MTTDKVDTIQYKWHDGNPIIVIEFDEYWTPVLIDTDWASKLVLWWDCDTGNYEKAMKLYSITDESEITSRVKEWHTVDIAQALEYVKDEYI